MQARKTKAKANKDLCRIVTPEFRVSYPHVFKPQAPSPRDKQKYSITMLFPKDVKLIGSTPQGEKRTIAGVIKQAKINEFGEDKNQWPELDSCIVDGDDPKFSDKEGYKGHWVIKASSTEDQKPTVVDRDMNPITNPNDLYPGCYARAYVFAYIWTFGNKQGVGFILDHVQKLRDGKSFGGKKPVEQVFQPYQSDEDEEDVEDFT